MRTAAELRSLMERRAWDKEIVVWLGSTDSLLSALPAGLSEIEHIDLLDLVPAQDLPDDDARTEFRRALDSRLKDLAPPPDKRCILVVTSAPLLAHFNTGLVGFFSWFCSDRAMVVLHVDGVPDKLDLPPEFEIRPNALLDYLVQPDHAKEIYS